MKVQYKTKFTVEEIRMLRGKLIDANCRQMAGDADNAEKAYVLINEVYDSMEIKQSGRTKNT